MTDHSSPPPPVGRKPAPSAPRPRTIALIGAGLLALAVLVGMLVWHLLSERVDAMRGQEPPRSAMALPATPAEPRLQGSAIHRALPDQDLADLRRRDQERLTRYAWVDLKAKIVRIPIERAMDLLGQRGLPVRGAAAATQPEAAATGPGGAPASQPASRPALHEP